MSREASRGEGVCFAYTHKAVCAIQELSEPSFTPVAGAKHTIACPPQHNIDKATIMIPEKTCIPNVHYHSSVRIWEALLR